MLSLFAVIKFFGNFPDEMFQNCKIFVTKGHLPVALFFHLGYNGFASPVWKWSQMSVSSWTPLSERKVDFLMKKSRKLLAMGLSLAMAFGLAACSTTGGQPTTTPSASPSASVQPSESTPAAEGKLSVFMITDKGDINDKSFNQGTWEGVQAWCAANDAESQYLKPADATTDDYVTSIEQAVSAGANVIVTPGFLFEEPIFLVQDKYPDVSFVLIDGNPHNADYTEFKTANNTVGILFAEEQVGYLAGYAAVKDGDTKLGFLGGMAVPAVVRYGYGFVQGANDAAAELGVKIDMKYYYTGGFAATPEAQAMAASWYNSGTEVIFACGGSVGNSAMAAAEANNGKVIGVDVDQSGESATVISSAMKGLSESVGQMLDAYKAGTFPGSENLVLGASENALGLPMSTSKWEKFSQADYDTLYGKLADGSITLKKDADADSKVYSETSDPTALGCENVTVEFVAS